jgi:HupE / UreJ protein
MMPRRALVAGLVLAVAAAASAARAHTGGSTGHAAVTIDGASIRYRLTLWPSTMPPAVAEELRLAREGRVHARDRLLAVVRDKVTLTAQGKRCAPGEGSLAPAAPGVESVTLVVDFACADAVRDLLIRDDLFDAFGADHHTIGRIDAPGSTTAFAFAPDMREARLTVAGAGGGRGVASFVALGIEHILTGWDHLLFLLALLLHGGGPLAMVKIITAFTIAHSVTLSLAVLDVVVLPGRLVEAVIALSIAAVAAENLFARPSVTRRWMVSFSFGLVHGFGFSSALRELGLPSQGLVLSLFGFNAGVELGQALVVAVALPALILLRRTSWEKRMIWGASMAILVVGLVLFVERAIL